MYIYTHIVIYIYIYIERERDTMTNLYKHLCVPTESDTTPLSTSYTIHKRTTGECLRSTVNKHGWQRCCVWSLVIYMSIPREPLWSHTSTTIIPITPCASFTALGNPLRSSREPSTKVYEVCKPTFPHILLRSSANPSFILRPLWPLWAGMPPLT